MDRIRQKSKKEKPMKHVEREKSPLFITDVKTIKENLKIKEILRSVKMNSSMRIKAPRGSVVMKNNDFSDVPEDHLDEHREVLDALPDALLEANNLDVVDKISHDTKQTLEDLEGDATTRPETQDEKQYDAECPAITDSNPSVPIVITTSEDHIDLSPDCHESRQTETGRDEPVCKSASSQVLPLVSTRERKYSLDHTILSRTEGLSQSEMDLHSIGKSPLERKSSFFRKKMDSFLKNTTEIFKRQSLGSKSQPVIRRGSMSISLQSLNEKTSLDNDHYSKINSSSQQALGSAASINSTSTLEGSEGDSNGSPAVLSASQPITADHQAGADGQSTYVSLYITGPQRTDSPFTLGAFEVDFEVEHEENVVSLLRLLLHLKTKCNEPKYEKVLSVDGAESLLSSRAISMSSGLDSAFGQRRRKTSRSNRVTWVASEGLTNYLRRLTQDEGAREIHAAHSYQDFSSIPENKHAPRLDSKGRRLSYQRAVSGEDPLPPRYDSSLRRRHLIPEHSEASYELSNQLADFTRNGVPSLTGYQLSRISDVAFSFIIWAETSANIENVYDWRQLPPNEESRQAVIRELVGTEADYIRHLMAIVEVFMAAAHALQDLGMLLELDTSRLFLNIPDVVNASLAFWEITFYPMLADAVGKGQPFNTEFMTAGFWRFREHFQPYEKYVSEQSKALEYYRSMSSNTDFMMYLTWCHAQKSCNRLQLSDIMVKPMQRLTKYSLILRRLVTHTETEPERTSLIAMETFAKNYVLDLNRTIRQREELEKLDHLNNSIDVLEIEFKDDEMEKCFRMYSSLNLKAPMVNCLPSHSRSLIHQGDLRFKDHAKEVEVRVFLLTDMMLICKKMSKGSSCPYKLIRPKYMVDRMVTFPRSARGSPALIVVMVDEVGSSCHSFTLSELAKDPNPHATIKVWEQKIREAKLTYDLGVWFARNPSRDLSEVEMDSSSDYGASAASGAKTAKQNSDDVNIEREARERVAAMLHRVMGASTEHDCSQASMATDSFDGEVSMAGTSGARTPALSLRHPMHRNSTSGSSRNSRLSSFQQSTSAASHDEPQAGPSGCSYRAGSSVEHVIHPFNPDDAVTSITVNVVSESESETVVPSPQPSVSPRKLPSRSPSGASHNTLRVHPQSGVLALMRSLPDLSLEPASPRTPPPPPVQSASEKLYQSHQELLQRNRLSASHHQYLTPDHRGTSYPSPSPTRASLRRGLAFSDSFKYPPLSKMGHVNSQSQLNAESAPSTSAAAKSEQGAVNPIIVASASGVEREKKSKQLINARNKSGSDSGAGPSHKDDKAG